MRSGTELSQFLRLFLPTLASIVLDCFGLPDILAASDLSLSLSLSLSLPVAVIFHWPWRLMPWLSWLGGNAIAATLSLSRGEISIFFRKCLKLG